MAKPQRRARKQSDPNQLNLLDFAPGPILEKSTRGGDRSAGMTALKDMRRARSDDAGSNGNVLTAKEAARYLRLSLATLKSWRAKKTGPAFVKRGARLIGYLPADLDAYLKAPR